MSKGMGASGPLSTGWIATRPEHNFRKVVRHVPLGIGLGQSSGAATARYTAALARSNRLERGCAYCGEVQGEVGGSDREPGLECAAECSESSKATRMLHSS